MSFVGGSQTKAGPIVEPWIDTSNRDAVLVAFDSEYANDTPSMDWTGNHETCEPGTSSERLAHATIRRVNFYRAMAGVPAGVTLNPEYSQKAQHAALTMSATGRLSHTPDDSFDCLSDTGREAAGNSNLYLGRTGPTAIDGYIEDPGDRNRDVGHRNTILHPPTNEIGVGHVTGTETAYPSNALWVFDDAVFDDSPDMREPGGFVAWPPRGHVPPELVYPRWSFGLADANFDSATVTMTTGGRSIELEVVARLSQKGYVPLPIIVWEPVPDPGSDDSDSLVIDAAYDTTVDVFVDGVIVDGAEVGFAYSVIILGERPEPLPGDDGADRLDVALRAAGQAARGLATIVIDRAD